MTTKFGFLHRHSRKCRGSHASLQAALTSVRRLTEAEMRNAASTSMNILRPSCVYARERIPFQAGFYYHLSFR